MKSAIFVNEGTTQVVLTPENEWEKNSLKMIQSGQKVATFWGSFFECRGGWYRTNDSDENSLMFRIDKERLEPPPDDSLSPEVFA